ncbi:alkyl hydroperoxide reductase subunit F (plasmid) [Sinorhizobium americanum]|uniref:Thioredoxin reductase n=1 Tax=Sinorhizobium americanum TaxID=194963 RepID=A0A1L3LUB2_9HYPH|nr:alkyl hydroperoxide reductase subunit F [Sinorhizobium americanum CCGM7]APG93643.1 alkyl hydroperoxide reductase subunit F [Sinorhizobium americanum]
MIEFDGKLKADDVLQRKLRSLPNVDVILSSKTMDVLGYGEKVTGLNYLSRASGLKHHLPLDGIFVQIGLLPNTDWLKGSIELSQLGEIVVDRHGRTSVPGVFAAGDCTTVPFKQIVVAIGEGAKASLSAFEHLIRAEDIDVPDTEPAIG